MGNVVQCCQALSSYFKCQEAPAQADAERSPLLSSDGSECDSPTLPDDLEDDASAAVTNPALEPEHFLFPDIILSSNLGGDVALVEPMVCLLVSEEEVGGGAEAGPGAEARGWSGGAGARGRAFSEVETQTELEVGPGAQTQTGTQAEVQTQTEALACSGEAARSEENAPVDAPAPVEPREDAVALAEIRSDGRLSTRTASEKMAGCRTWCDADVFADPEEPRMKTDGVTWALRGEEAEREQGATLARTVVQTEQHGGLGEVGTAEEQQRTTRESVLGNAPTQEDTGTDPECGEKNASGNAAGSEPRDHRRIGNLDPGTAGDPDSAAAQQTGEEAGGANLSPGNADETGDETRSPAGLQPVLEVASPVPQAEVGGAQMTQMTLFLVDRLFLEAPHVGARQSQIGGTPDEPEVDGSEQRSIRDIVDLQEMGFTVRIQPPGADSFELQVSGQMLVVELQQVLMDHELTCHRTSFSLQLGGATLDGLSELSSIEGFQDGALIRVVEESYSVRDARLHLRHVRDLLRSLDPADAYNGVNGSSLSYLTFYTRGHKDGDGAARRRASDKEPVDCGPPEFVLPGCKERPLLPLQPVRGDRKPLQCLRVLTMSSWNPPPGNRKMHGDLMYLNVVTMEDRELNITSSTRGFYLNQSTAFSFNPKPAAPKILCHSLVELLCQVSAAFRKNFTALQKKRVQQHPYERIAAPFQVFTWIAPHGDHVLDGVRAEETHTSHMGQDEHTAGQSRDWNEELQGCRELPRDSLQERLNRERSIFKTNSEFVGAAGRGAVAVIDGNVMPLNPGEAPHMQMFIWNNLFFSLGFDISDHYRPLGGNTAAHAAAVCDLRGAQAYACVDAERLHTLGTAVVDYRGIRVIAQTIVPGILEKNQEQSVVYGSNDYGKTVFTHPRFVELLEKTCKPLRIQQHQVLDHNNVPVDLCSGIETKGILGNDGRHYVLDLLRTFPPDLNFQFSESPARVEGDVPEECRRFGYPRRHPHRLASLRPELMEAFVQLRYESYVKMVSELDNENMERDPAETTGDGPRAGNAASAGGDIDLRRRTAVMEACKAVGSASDSGFDIRFNPDVCSPGVRFPAASAEEVQAQRRLLWDAAAFLLSHQVPLVLKDCLDHTAVPMDGASLTAVLHQRGVNVRYLGALLGELDRMQEVRLQHIQRISVSEVVLRSAKHVFRTYLQDVEPACFSAAVSHFLNCLLSSSLCLPDSSSSSSSSSSSNEPPSRRRSRRRRSHGNRAPPTTGGAWARLTRAELWGRIRTEAEDYYHYTIDSDSIDEVIDRFSLQRVSLLRELALKTGIQVQMRDYAFDSRHRAAFSEDDVVNMFPVVKHLRPAASDASRLVRRAQGAIRQGLLRDGQELVSQALTLFSSVCGVLHEDVCACLRLLGRLSYILGEHADALSHQEKAVMSSERTQGVDHPQTIHDYTFLALYCFAGGQHATSLRLLYRARYLTLLVSGEEHPQVALLDSMLGLVLHALAEYELSLKFLQSASALTSRYHGAASLKHAHSCHLLATVYESKGEFRSALRHEREAFSIYKSQVGEHHDSTRESSEYLEGLTQQAVALQKAINHLYSDAPGASVPPPKFSTPNLPTILRQLNLVCGIVLVPLSEKDVADLRT